MKLLRASDYKRMPWKNGKGETVEIAVFPEGATVDTFDWRISMATVVEDGPFSMFENIDRTLSVLDGDGVTLSIEGEEDMRLTASSQPYSFAGDRSTRARLLSGPISDLNVMTRRGRFEHRVTRLPLPAASLDSPTHGLKLVFAETGMRMAAPDIELDRHATVILEPGDPSLDLQSDDIGTVLVVELLSVVSSA